MKPNCGKMWTKIKIKGKRDLLIGAYYRPPVCYESSLREFAESTRLACHSKNATIVVGEDFNFPGWNWTDYTLKSGKSHSCLHHPLTDTVSDLGLDQIVDRGESTLDLILTNYPNMVPRLEIMRNSLTMLL